MKQNQKKIIGSIVVLITVWVIKFMYQHSPKFCERNYGENIYPFVQNIQNTINQIFSVILFKQPLAYLIILIVIGLVLLFFVQLMRKKWTWWTFFANFLELVSGIYVLFYLCWGFNYFRPSLTDHLHLELSAPSADYVLQDFEQTITQLNAIRRQIEPIDDTISWYDEQLDDYTADLEAKVKEFVQQAGYNTDFDGRIRLLKPKGVLMRFSTSGMQFPFTGEALVDSGMPMMRRPHTIAHELSHTYGITGEGECNFVAFEACMASSSQLANYSALLHYYSYASRVTFQTDSVFFKQANAQLDSIIIQDIQSLRKCSNQFPDLIPKVRDSIYDSYLKAQGIEDGITNYAQIYLIKHAWSQRDSLILQ